MPVDFSGKWYNQLGSSMELKVDAQGIVTGTYSTAVGAPKPSDLFDIRGVVLDDLISFIVRWKNAQADFGSITAWVGQMTKESDGTSDRIETLWHLAKNIPDPDEPSQLWGTVRTGADRFRRNPYTSAAKLSSGSKLAGSEPLAGKGPKQPKKGK